MRKSTFGFVVTIGLLAAPAWAQCPTVGDAIQLLQPALTVSVVRDVSDQDGACSVAPQAWECSSSM
jgi:hypothetical protein